MDAIAEVRKLPRLLSPAEAKHGSKINCLRYEEDRSSFNADAKELLESLLQNKELETLVMDWDYNFKSLEGCKALGELVRTSTTLKHLSLWEVGMHGEGLKLIVEGILENPKSALEVLDLGANKELGLHHVGVSVVTDRVGEDAKQLADLVDSLESWRALGRLVRSSTTLRHLSLDDVGMCGEGLKFIVEGILNSSQSVLESLDLGGNGDLGGGATMHDDAYVGEGANQLMALLSSNDGALATLDAGGICFSADETERISTALASNTTLINLTLGHSLTSNEAWKIFLDSLKVNKNVQTLHLWGDRGDDFFENLMGVLRVNYTIKKIDVYPEELDDQRCSQLEGMLLRNQRLGEYMSTLQENFQFMKPSIGRVFLCGSPKAGKTTLRTTMVASEAGWRRKAGNKAKSILQQTCLLRQPDERTKGIEVQSLKVSTGEQIAIWDMAGQDEYRALHDSHFLFPDISQACLFIFVFKAFDEGKEHFNLSDASARLEKEMIYWLSFINSNSRMGDFILPQVSVVLTHLDKLIKIGQFSNAKTYVEWAEEKVKEMRVRFCDKVQVHEVIHAVDSTSHKDACAVAKHVRTVIRDLFNRVGEMPVVCEGINVVMGKWILDHKLEPIMGTREFLQLCVRKVPEVTSLFQNAPRDLPENAGNKIWQAIISYLHFSGCTLHFPESDSIVVDVNWLGETFLGRLFNSKDTNMQEMIRRCQHGRGTVDKYHLKWFLNKFVNEGKYRGMDAEILIALMIELKICEYEDSSSASSSLFMPRTLRDAEGKAYSGTRKLQWSDMRADYQHEPVFTGVRLQAEDPLRTFLSPGLFLRYQVHLHRLLSRDIAKDRFTYEIEANFIRVNHDGMEMLIESCGEMHYGDYVDILIQCYDPPTSRDHYTYKYGVSELRKFCALPEGCPGVFLKEAILRPECAEKLTLCVHRKNQAVSTRSLKESVKEKLFQYVGELQASGMWNKGDSAKMIIEQSIDSKIYRHRFDAVPEAGLGEVRVKATSLLDDWTDIDNALISHRQSAIDEVASICNCQAADEVRRTIKFAVSASPQPSTSSSSSTAQPVEDQDENRPVTFRDIQNMERKLLLRFEKNKNEILSGTKIMIVSALDNVVKDMRAIQRWQEEQIDMMKELKQMAVFQQQQYDMPKFPYFTCEDVKLSRRILALTAVGKAFKLHFMCEEPRQPHFVKDQEGFDITSLNQEEWAKVVRPIVSASVKTFVILLRVAAHVGAGIGSAIPNFHEWQGALPMNIMSSATDTALNLIKRTDSNTVDHEAIISAQQCLVDEIVGPLMQEKKIPAIFGIYQVQYKSNYLTGQLSTSRFWVCRKCRDEAYKAGKLVGENAQVRPMGIIKKSDSKLPCYLSEEIL